MSMLSQTTKVLVGKRENAARIQPANSDKHASTPLVSTHRAPGLSPSRRIHHADLRHSPLLQVARSPGRTSSSISRPRYASASVAMMILDSISILHKRMMEYLKITDKKLITVYKNMLEQKNIHSTSNI
jgi:hypothetical protein